MKKSMQKGFTLIELMIVVAIIAILAAIAIPVYSDYVAKSQATAALAEITGGKTPFELALTEGNPVADPIHIGLSDSTARCSAITVDEGTPAGTGSFINCTMIGATDKIGGKYIRITRTEQTEAVAADPENGVEASEATSAKWECTSDAAQKFLPAGCRTA